MKEISKNLAIIILAAGKGTRMKSNLPKVLHKVAGKPMINYVVETALELGGNPIILVVGYQAEKVMANFKGEQNLDFVLQKEQLGTGHAVLQTQSLLKNFWGDVLVLYGDVPFTRTETLNKLIEKHRKTKAAATILTTIMQDPTRYGRIIRSPQGGVQEIIEHSDLTEEQSKIKEINTGIICFNKDFLFEALAQVKVNQLKGEIYLTDTIKILRQKNLIIEAKIVENNIEVIGLDTKEKLRIAEEKYLKSPLSSHRQAEAKS